jgi:uroporphyrinogen decarboxylase
MNRKWIQDTIAHRETGRVPYNFMFSPPARERVERHYEQTTRNPVSLRNRVSCSVEEILGFPIRMTGPKSVKPLYADPREFGPTLKDEFGVVWTTSDIDRGSPVGPCLPEPDLSNYRFPDPSAPYRFEHIGEWCASNHDHYTIIWVGDLWERATFMRGMENILLDLVMNPRFVAELLRHLTDHILATMEILFDRFQFDGIAVSDDYGTQKSLLMSPSDWRRFIKPLLAEIYGSARKHGRTIFHHTCGNIYPIIGDFIDIGLDILHPIQPEAMDILKLKRDFGRRLTFCGGVRTQDLLPRGTPAEVRAEVRRLKREMGAGGGYILEPGITLQTDVPLENIIAMMDEARKNP